MTTETSVTWIEAGVLQAIGFGIIALLLWWLTGVRVL
jgi:hypothetical protein